MNRRLARHLGLAAVLALTGHIQAALALEGYPESWCRGGMFARPLGKEADLELARIVGQRAYLLSDVNGCPLTGTQCRKRVFVDPGTAVAVLPSTLAGVACVQVVDQSGEHTGWLPQAQVQMVPRDPGPPALATWTGTWHALGGNTIVLATGEVEQLRVDGHAYWPGIGIPPQHTGELSGTSRPEGNRVTFKPDDPATCRAKLTLLGGDLLVANDNDQCGGANVSFSGVYRRAR